jgi:hypothetical protein
MAGFQENAICSLLAVRYAAPAWAFLRQVRNQTGFRGGRIRTADAIAMSLYPSRGHELHGFEIKVSRSDWQRELAAPDKAESICKHCDRWWVVVDRAEIVQPGELPPTWGLMLAGGEKTRVLTEAPKLKPKPITTALVCSILRNVQETTVPLADVQPKLRAAREEGIEEGNRRNAYHLEELRRKSEEFRVASGIDIAGEHRWQLGHVGRVVKLLKDARIFDAIETARSLRNMARVLLRETDGIESELEKFAQLDEQQTEPVNPLRPKRRKKPQATQ